MARNRRTPPLFEVMRATNPTRLPVQVIPPTPAERGSFTLSPGGEVGAGAGASRGTAAPGPVRGEGSAPSHGDGAAPMGDGGDGRAWDLNRVHAIPGRLIIAAFGVALVVFFAGWAVAYKMGVSSESERLMSPSRGVAGPTVGDGRGAPAADPLVDRTGAGTAAPAGRDGAAAPRTGTGGGAGDSRTGRADAGGTASGTAGAGVAGGAGGSARQPGYNYLIVKTLQRQQDAEATAAFLTANGVPAAAVSVGRVDPAGGGSKNRLTWQIIVLEGIASAEYRRGSARRVELEARVKQLGLQWARDPRGGFDFSDCHWSLYRAPSGS